jgi:uncharacterized protein
MKNMELRKSSYTISVKLESEDDKYMLLHGYTGAIVIAYIDNINKPQPDCIQVSEATLEALATRGYLTMKTTDEEVEYVRKLADLLHQKEKILHKNFVFLVAYDCNFRCPYCYESKILKDSRQWSRKVFDREMVDKAYDALVTIGGDRKLHSSKIILYGGEPLLAQNKNIVEYIVRKGHDLGYNFMAVTNGYDLDSYIDLLTPDMINFLQITIDGMREKHDKRRIHYPSKKSFDKIIANIGLALNQSVNVGIRVNTDGNNFSDLDKLDQMFDELGYYTKEKAKLFINSALLSNRNLNQSLENNATLDFINQEEFNNKHNDLNFKHQCSVTAVADLLLRSMRSKSRINFSSIFCAAQSGSYILDPFGDIYCCWEDVGRIKGAIGNYNNANSIEWTTIRDMWQSKNIGISSECVLCKYAFFCRGGCLSQGFINKGVHEPGYCNYFSNTFTFAVNYIFKNKKELMKKNCNIVTPI